MYPEEFDINFSFLTANLKRLKEVALFLSDILQSSALGMLSQVLGAVVSKTQKYLQGNIVPLKLLS